MVGAVNSESKRGRGSATIFDPLLDDSKDLLSNPYPKIEIMREHGPIVWSPRGNQWVVLGYDEASLILRSKSFGKKIFDKWKHPDLLMRGFIYLTRRRTGQSMLIQDPPDHTRIRALVSSAFTPTSIKRLEGRLADICDQLLINVDAKLKSEGKVDLIREFCFPLPVIVIAELLGVPVKDREKFKQWSTRITQSLGGSGSLGRVVDSILAMNSLRDYLLKIIQSKRLEPGDDLISSMVKAQSAEYSRLSDSELLANTVLILIAGHETTVNLLGNGVYNLLNHSEQLERLRAQPDLIPGAIEEILRFDPPVQIVRRIAHEDTEYDGVVIRKDEALTVLTAGCNRDARANPDPLRFDIERANIKHLTFGAGIHYCLGAELARTETRIAFAKLFERYPTLKLSKQRLEYKGPLALRGFKRLFIER